MRETQFVCALTLSVGRPK